MHFQSSSESDALSLLLPQYYADLIAPVDGMWDSFGAMGKNIVIFERNEPIGFFTCNEQNELIRFFIVQNYQKEVERYFNAVLDQHNIHSAYAGSHDPIFLGLASKRSTSKEKHTALHQAANKQTMPRPEAVASFHIRNAFEPDLEKSMAFLMESVEGINKQWLKGYFQERIDQFELYLLIDNRTIIGTFEVRVSPAQKGIADVGMAVHPKFRAMGIGAYLINQSKVFAYDLGLRPICSTEYSNIGSRKAIQAAGFDHYHDLFALSFAD